MRAARRVAFIVSLAVVAIAAFVAWNTYGAWPVPDGYEFPRHTMWGGPDALYEGTLEDTDGCILTETGETVIWPSFHSLAIVDGEPVVRGLGRDIRMGEPVALGGGWYDQAQAEAVYPGTLMGEWDCPPRYFLATGP